MTTIVPNQPTQELPGSAEFASRRRGRSGCSHWPRDQQRFPTRLGFFFSSSPSNESIGYLDTNQLCEQCLDSCLPEGYNAWSMCSTIRSEELGGNPRPLPERWLDAPQSASNYPPIYEIGTGSFVQRVLPRARSGPVVLPIPQVREALAAWEWIRQQRKPFYLDQLHLIKGWAVFNQNTAEADSSVAARTGILFHPSMALGSITPAPRGRTSQYNPYQPYRVHVPALPSETYPDDANKKYQAYQSPATTTITTTTTTEMTNGTIQNREQKQAPAIAPALVNRPLKSGGAIRRKAIRAANPAEPKSVQNIQSTATASISPGPPSIHLGFIKAAPLMKSSGTYSGQPYASATVNAGSSMQSSSAATQPLGASATAMRTARTPAVRKPPRNASSAPSSSAQRSVPSATRHLITRSAGLPEAVTNTVGNSAYPGMRPHAGDPQATWPSTTPPASIQRFASPMTPSALIPGDASRQVLSPSPKPITPTTKVGSATPSPFVPSMRTADGSAAPPPSSPPRASSSSSAHRPNYTLGWSRLEPHSFENPAPVPNLSNYVRAAQSSSPTTASFTSAPLKQMLGSGYKPDGRDALRDLQAPASFDLNAALEPLRADIGLHGQPIPGSNASSGLNRSLPPLKSVVTKAPLKSASKRPAATAGQTLATVTRGAIETPARQLPASGTQSSSNNTRKPAPIPSTQKAPAVPAKPSAPVTANKRATVDGSRAPANIGKPLPAPRNAVASAGTNSGPVAPPRSKPAPVEQTWQQAPSNPPTGGTGSRGFFGNNNTGGRQHANSRTQPSPSPMAKHSRQRQAPAPQHPHSGHAHSGQSSSRGGIWPSQPSPGASTAQGQDWGHADQRSAPTHTYVWYDPPVEPVTSATEDPTPPAPNEGAAASYYYMNSYYQQNQADAVPTGWAASSPCNVGTQEQQWQLPGQETDSTQPLEDDIYNGSAPISSGIDFVAILETLSSSSEASSIESPAITHAESDGAYPHWAPGDQCADQQAGFDNSEDQDSGSENEGNFVPGWYVNNGNYTGQGEYQGSDDGDEGDDAGGGSFHDFNNHAEQGENDDESDQAENVTSVSGVQDANEDDSSQDGSEHNYGAEGCQSDQDGNEYGEQENPGQYGDAFGYQAGSEQGGCYQGYPGEVAYTQGEESYRPEEEVAWDEELPSELEPESDEETELGFVHQEFDEAETEEDPNLYDSNEYQHGSDDDQYWD